MLLNKYQNKANTTPTTTKTQIKSSSVISGNKVNTSSPGHGIKPKQNTSSDDTGEDYDLLTLDLSTIRISALTKAARISHLVTGKTIGPLSKKEKEKEEQEKCRNIEGTSIPIEKDNINIDINRVSSKSKLTNWQPHNINNKHNTLDEINVHADQHDQRLDEVREESEDHELNTKIKSIYYDQINSNIAMKLAERHRLDEVKRELDAHNERYKIQDKKIAIDIADKLKLAREKQQLKRQQQAQEIIDIGRKYDNETEECQKQYHKRMETHNKWMVEQTRKFEDARIQREQQRIAADALVNAAAAESQNSETVNDNTGSTDKEKIQMNLYKYRDEFDTNFRGYVEFLNSNAPLLTTEQYNEHCLQQNTYLNFFETLRLELRQRSLNENDIEYLRKLAELTLNSYTSLQNQIHEIIVRLQLEEQQQQQQQPPPSPQTESSTTDDVSLGVQKQPEQQPQPQQQQQVIESQPSPPGQTDTVDTAIANHVNGLRVRDDSEHVIYYCDLTDYYRLYEADVRPLTSDDALKTFRFNCKKAINIPLNTISAVSAQHLQNKYDRLVTLLSGNYVTVGDTQFSANEHPLGIKYCKLLLAKKFVGQADSMVSSSPKSAYPIASVIVAIWQLYPDVGQLFLGFLYYENPSLVPLFIEKPETLFPNASEVQFPRYLGYKCIDGQLETLDLFLKRLAGRTRLYAAVIITKVRTSNQLKHPHGLEYGWRWLTNVLNIAPYRDLTATTLHEFLQVAGYDMWQFYGKQFSKVIHYLLYQYMLELVKIDEGGPMARLQVLLIKIMREGKIDPPDGLLPINFW